MRTPVRGNIRGEIWTRTINSLCWNPVAALTGSEGHSYGEDLLP
jgi:hypothetical protein